MNKSVFILILKNIMIDIGMTENYKMKLNKMTIKTFEFNNNS